MIGLVTIGASPRDDIVSSMFGSDRPEGIVEAGALDNKSEEEIAALAPRAGETVLVTRRQDGREVHVAENRLFPHVQAAVDNATDRGATLVCIMCTGDFRKISSSVRLVTPDSLVASVVDVLVPDGTLGVLMPHADQARSILTKWKSPGRHVTAFALSPYDHEQETDRVARALRAAAVDLVVLDCMAYSRDLAFELGARIDVPVILSNGLTGSILAEIACCRPDGPGHRQPSGRK